MAIENKLSKSSNKTSLCSNGILLPDSVVTSMRKVRISKSGPMILIFSNRQVFFQKLRHGFACVQNVFKPIIVEYHYRKVNV